MIRPGHASFGVATRPYLAAVALLLVGGLALLAIVAQARAQEDSAQETGLRIAREASSIDDGFGNMAAAITMVLRNRRGQESRRQMRLKVLEVADDGDKSLFVFDQPRDVQGTAFLTHGHTHGPDDQWLYLPALKRVKRISSSTRSGSFMGSEFSYEDLGSPEVEKYTYNFLRSEPCGELSCTVVEQFPVDDRSSYSRQIVWRDTDELRTWKVEYYDRKDSHLKTLVFSDFAQYLDRYWRAREMNMVNHLTGKSTLMTWNDFRFRTELDDSEFTRTGLRRVR